MDRVRLKRETTAEMVFAHPRLGGWLLLPAAYAMVWFAQSRIDEPVGLWAVTVAGMVFGTVALLALLWRFDVTFDLPGRSYSGKRGFWPGARALQGSLTELQSVSLERAGRGLQRSSEGSDDPMVWSVRLHFRGWDRPLSIFETRDERVAYTKLEHYARKLGVEAIDRTGVREVRRDLAALDRRGFAAADRSAGTATRAGNPPERSGILWNAEEGEGAIVVPPLGFSISTAFFGLFGVTFAGFGTLPLLSLSGTIDVAYHGSHAVGWALGTLFVLIGLGLSVGGLVGSLSRQVIHERRDGLHFSQAFRGYSWQHRFVLKRTVEEIAVKQLTQTAGSRTEVVLRSDDEIIRFAGHLTSEEQDWLTHALQMFICR